MKLDWLRYSRYRLRIMHRISDFRVPHSRTHSHKPIDFITDYATYFGPSSIRRFITLFLLSSSKIRCSAIAWTKWHWACVCGMYMWLTSYTRMCVSVWQFGDGDIRVCVCVCAHSPLSRLFIIFLVIIKKVGVAELKINSVKRRIIIL